MFNRSWYASFGLRLMVARSMIIMKDQWRRRAPKGRTPSLDISCFTGDFVSRIDYVGTECGHVRL